MSIFRILFAITFDGTCKAHTARPIKAANGWTRSIFCDRRKCVHSMYEPQEDRIAKTLASDLVHFAYETALKHFNALARRYKVLKAVCPRGALGVRVRLTLPFSLALAVGLVWTIIPRASDEWFAGMHTWFNLTCMMQSSGHASDNPKDCRKKML